MSISCERKNKLEVLYSYYRALKYSLLVGIIAILFTGCMANLANSVGIDITNSVEQNENFIAGNYAGAAALAVENKNKESKLDEENLLSTLKAGNSYLYANYYDDSIKMLDESEAIIKFHHEEALALSGADYMVQLMFNDAVIDYHASISDSVMVNTYKSLNYMALGKLSEARVELNRAVDRQRRAKNTYAELIQKQKDAISHKRREGNSKAIDKTLDNSQLKSSVARNYSYLEEFKTYPDFINPFTTYLAGLFFAIEGDYSKSSSLLKEVYGMMPDNKTVKADFEMVESALSGELTKDKYVWVIYENGLCPVKYEYKITIPVWLVPNKINYTEISLPKMYIRSQATPKLSIISNGKLLNETSVVGDMDRVILTEFKYSYNDILTRAVFSTLLKTYAQHEAEKREDYVGFATTVFRLLTTHSDTRVWNSMPKDFQIARVKMPNDGKLLLKAGTHSIDVKVDSNAKGSIVYVRIPTAKSKPGFSIINF